MKKAPSQVAVRAMKYMPYGISQQIIMQKPKI